MAIDCTVRNRQTAITDRKYKMPLTSKIAFAKLSKWLLRLKISRIFWIPPEKKLEFTTGRYLKARENYLPVKEAYEREFRLFLDTQAGILAEGLKEGMKEGLKKGLEEGLEEGLKKGREEALNIFQTAIDMKKQGIDNQLIAEKTGLPLSLIESLK